MPATGGSNNLQPEDTWRVPLYVTNPGGGGYSPYRISISQYTMEQANAPLNAPGTTAQLPDDSANVLGKAYIANPFPQSTTDADFSGVVPNSPGSTPANQAPFPVPNSTIPGSNPPAPYTINAGVDAGNYFLIGPKSNLGSYEDPFAANLPPNIPVLQTDSVTYTPTWVANPTNPDERTTGLTVMLRRLANPYLPPQLDPTKPNYNPYVTVDYISSVPIQESDKSIFSFGKRQPYAGLLKLAGSITYNNGIATIPFASPTDSPVAEQSATAVPTPPMGAIVTTNNVSNTFGRTNYPLPNNTGNHYDWLVHLDRPPISPMELLHVSAWPSYKLTQKFIQGDESQSTTTLYTTIPPDPTKTTQVLSTFGHYAPWLDTLPGGVGASTATTTPPPISCPWWFDIFNLSAGSSHRLYRLFEFFECGDRAYGVNGLGRIPGKVNINTIWDAETLQALIDANMSMGIAPNPANTPLNLPGDVVSQIFTNMMISRSPAYYNMGTYTNTGTFPYPVSIGPVNMGTGTDDRPFMPLSTGQYLASGSGGSLQFPNGFSVITDTLLRTNNPFLNKNNTTGNMLAYPPPQTATSPQNQWLLFQNYTDTQGTHPYLQTQLLTKLFNNVTTRSNVFAVFLTVGFFQVMTNPATGEILPAVGQKVTPGMPYIPQLGPELGASEGKQIRHRMFAIVDRTNLTTFTTNSATAISGVTPINPTGTQTIQLPVLPPPLTITGTGTGATAQLFVPNPNTGVPGLIQAGTQLVIDPGNVNEETVTVSAVTPPAGTAPATITANFTLPHAAGATIVQRGNPGPWLTPYDPRLDSNVVLYFSIID